MDSLSSAWPNTRNDSITVITHRHDAFSLLSARLKILDKEVVASIRFTEGSVLSAAPNKEFFECMWFFCRVLFVLGKEVVFGSVC